MKSLDPIRKWEFIHPLIGHKGVDGCGTFKIPYEGKILMVVSSDQFGWDHVSVTIEGNNSPNWEMLCYIKNLFFYDEETVVQFIPKKSAYISYSEALHLWRNQKIEYELPPGVMI
jgi:hypothetical protein